jgi:hypothetical protein
LFSLCFASQARVSDDGQEYLRLTNSASTEFPHVAIFDPENQDLVWKMESDSSDISSVKQYVLNYPIRAHDATIDVAQDQASNQHQPEAVLSKKLPHDESTEDDDNNKKRKNSKSPVEENAERSTTATTATAAASSSSSSLSLSSSSIVPDGRVTLLEPANDDNSNNDSTTNNGSISTLAASSSTAAFPAAASASMSDDDEQQEQEHAHDDDDHSNKKRAAALDDQGTHDEVANHGQEEEAEFYDNGQTHDVEEDVEADGDASGALAVDTNAKVAGDAHSVSGNNDSLAFHYADTDAVAGRADSRVAVAGGAGDDDAAASGAGRGGAAAAGRGDHDAAAVLQLRHAAAAPPPPQRHDTGAAGADGDDGDAPAADLAHATAATASTASATMTTMIMPNPPPQQHQHETTTITATTVLSKKRSGDESTQDDDNNNQRKNSKSPIEENAERSASCAATTLARLRDDNGDDDGDMLMLDDDEGDVEEDQDMLMLDDDEGDVEEDHAAEEQEVQENTSSTTEVDLIERIRASETVNENEAGITGAPYDKWTHCFECNTPYRTFVNKDVNNPEFKKIPYVWLIESNVARFDHIRGRCQCGRTEKKAKRRKKGASREKKYISQLSIWGRRNACMISSSSSSSSSSPGEVDLMEEIRALETVETVNKDQAGIIDAPYDKWTHCGECHARFRTFVLDKNYTSGDDFDSFMQFKVIPFHLLLQGNIARFDHIRGECDCPQNPNTAAREKRCRQVLCFWSPRT